jgi:hypothetical protein
MVIKMSAFETLEKVNRYTKSSLKRMPSSASLPTTRTSCAEASAQRLGRARPAGFPQRLESIAST